MASGFLRSRVMLRLFRWRFRKSEPSRAPPMLSPGPSGISTLITLAPQSASWRTHVGPARTRVRSITVNRFRASDAGLKGIVSPQPALCSGSAGRPALRACQHATKRGKSPALGIDSGSLRLLGSRGSQHNGSGAMTIKRSKVGARMSQSVVHGDTVYLAGQVADDPSTDVAG